MNPFPGPPRAYPRSQAVLRRAGVQWPEALPPAAWAEYAATKAAEDRHYDALDRARRQTLLDAATKGRATRAARSAARRLKVAAALAVDPHPNLTALAQSLGISRVCLYNDRRALGLLKPGVCPGCQRPL